MLKAETQIASYNFPSNLLTEKSSYADSGLFRNGKCAILWCEMHFLTGLQKETGYANAILKTATTQKRFNI